MKKITNYLFVALMATGLLSSCGDDNDKQEDPSPKTTEPAKITGSWHLVSFLHKKYAANGTLLDTVYYTHPKGYYIETYSEPNTLTVVTSGKTEVGVYEIKQDSIIKPFMDNAGTGNYRLKIDSLTSTRLVLNITMKNAVNGKTNWQYKYSR